ncbi:MAG: 16S rRNA (cytosine(1402)-N(4))-methyltransferase RsmH [Duodenibacillus sp.]|nr:16S rRNA (cytosine(1402)-N(4))-methyltransferase RsmH [Duodenibacillus sp.]
MTALRHISVLAQAAPRAVFTKPDGLYVDGTFGRGGHSRALLGLMAPGGRLIAFDRDPEAVASAAAIEDPRFEIVHSPFSAMAEELARRGIDRVDGVLLDIGVSSPQIDDPARGFSLRFDGPLDMRMDTSRGMTAAAWLAAASEGEIAAALRDYGEERYARAIARALAARRRDKPFETTSDLAQAVARAVPRSRGDAGQHPATRTFQAIRILVNDELGELRKALAAAGSLLAPGGKLGVISFHSLEDRCVKRFFAAGEHPERAIDAALPLAAADLPAPWWRGVERIRPDGGEAEGNPRARSAVMRAGVRTARPWEARAAGGAA